MLMKNKYVPVELQFEFVVPVEGGAPTPTAFAVTPPAATVCCVIEVWE
jgi:hypothetical protein